jgi:hypothetical protein
VRGTEVPLNETEDMEDMLKRQHEEDFNAWWEVSGLAPKVNKGVALQVWLAARGWF